MNIVEAATFLTQRAGFWAVRPTGMVFTVTRLGALQDPRTRNGQFPRLNSGDLVAIDWAVLTPEQYVEATLRDSCPNDCRVPLQLCDACKTARCPQHHSHQEQPSDATS